MYHTPNLPLHTHLPPDLPLHMHTLTHLPPSPHTPLLPSRPHLQILTTHLDYDHPHLHSTLVSLAQIAKLQPAVFETKHKLIIRDFVVKKLLVTDRVGTPCNTLLKTNN